MSGVLLLWNRDGAPADPAVVAPMLATLDHRGPDGCHVTMRRSLALGHQHFWATPEAAGERQPLSDPIRQVDIAFDGRLDNRGELLRALGLPHPSSLSDTALVLRAYRQWGERCFERLLGPFAVVLYDATGHRVVCARDALGSRTLFYHASEGLLVVASEVQAVLAHPTVSWQLDERSLALFFALEVPGDGATFFRDVREVLPAHVLMVDAHGLRQWRYWQPRIDPDWRRATDQEFAEQYRTLLAESVRCRLRTVSKPAVLMSGGMDSTSVAALAAQELAGAGHGGRLRTISWLFNELKACDERTWIDVMADQFDLDSLRLIGDDAWTLRDWQTWPWDPGEPGGNVHRRLLERAYQVAHRAGVRTLLTGVYGDELYMGGEDWLADLLAEQRLVEASQEIWRHLGQPGAQAMRASRPFRRVASRALDQVPGARWLLPHRSPAAREWLTPAAAQLSLAHVTGTSKVPVTSVRRLSQAQSLLGPLAAHDASREIYFANQAGIELRHPYRDRRLVEFMLSVPAHQLYNRGRYKHVLRNAMDGVLPDSVCFRKHNSSLAALFMRGIGERETGTARALLYHPDSAWQKYVQPGWLRARLDALSYPTTAGQETEYLVLWLCISFELWKAKLERSSLSETTSRSWKRKTTTSILEV